MFDLDLPWWEYSVRGVMIYIALLVMMRLSGKRTIGQFTPFDLLVIMLLSEAVSPGLTGGDHSVAGGLIVVVTLVILNLAIAFVTARNEKAAELVEGTAVLIGRDGKFFNEVLKRNHVAESDVEQSLREADCPLESMKFAFLEADGKITILQH
ncbi:MAG TPA: YetF domain-containing protein [Pseudoduganella sp.]